MTATDRDCKMQRVCSKQPFCFKVSARTRLLRPCRLCPFPEDEAAKDATAAKEEAQTDDGETKGADESEPGSAAVEPASEAEAKTSGDEQLGAPADDADGEAKMDTDD